MAAPTPSTQTTSTPTPDSSLAKESKQKNYKLWFAQPDLVMMYDNEFGITLWNIPGIDSKFHVLRGKHCVEVTLETKSLRGTPLVCILVEEVFYKMSDILKEHIVNLSDRDCKDSDGKTLGDYLVRSYSGDYSYKRSSGLDPICLDNLSIPILDSAFVPIERPEEKEKKEKKEKKKERVDEKKERVDEKREGKVSIYNDILQSNFYVKGVADSRVVYIRDSRGKPSNKICIDKRSTVEEGPHENANEFIFDIFPTLATDTNRELLKHVLKQVDPDVRCKHSNSVTLLMLIVRLKNCKDMVMDIIDRSSNSLDEIDDNGLSAIHYCRSPETIDLLLSLGAKLELNAKIMEHIQNTRCVGTLIERFFATVNDRYDSGWIVGMIRRQIPAMTLARITDLIKSSPCDRLSKDEPNKPYGVTDEMIDKITEIEIFREKEFLRVHPGGFVGCNLESRMIVKKRLDWLIFTILNGYGTGSALKKLMENGFKLKWAEVKPSGNRTSIDVDDLKTISLYSYDINWPKGKEFVDCLIKSGIDLQRATEQGTYMCGLLSKDEASTISLIQHGVKFTEKQIEIVSRHSEVSESIQMVLAESGQYDDVTLMKMTIKYNWMPVASWFISSGKDIKEIIAKLVSSIPKESELYSRHHRDMWELMFEGCKISDQKIREAFTKCGCPKSLTELWEKTSSK